VSTAISCGERYWVLHACPDLVAVCVARPLGLIMQRLYNWNATSHLMMSSFNELFGGRQPSSYQANTAINMGLPYHAQNRTVLTDT